MVEPTRRHAVDARKSSRGRSIHRLAGEGKTVDSGGFTQFGLRGILGGSNNGLLYVDAVPLVRRPLESALRKPC